MPCPVLVVLWQTCFSFALMLPSFLVPDGRPKSIKRERIIGADQNVDGVLFLHYTEQSVFTSK